VEGGGKMAATPHIDSYKLQIKKPLLFLVLVICIYTFFPVYHAVAQQLPGYEGGIKNDMEYRELFVLTGKPVLLKGEMKHYIGAMRDGKRQDRLTYRLESEDKDIALNRSMTFDVRLEEDKQKRQVVTLYELVRFSESINVKSQGRRADRYTLDKCELYSSTVTDMSPAVDYYSLSIKGKRVYLINRDEGSAIVELSGSGVGYEHAWGATETRDTDYIISVKRDTVSAEGATTEEWVGSQRVIQSFNRTRDLAYVPNEPTQISFKGGYLETVKDESVARYSYNLPRFDKEGNILKDRYVKDEHEIKLSTVPTQKRTFVPKILDIGGHWAEGEIDKMLSIGVLSPTGQYFGPRSPATRLTFARGVARLLNIVERGEKMTQISENLSRRRMKRPEEPPPPFDDIKSNGEDLEYIKNLDITGVMQGVGPGRFGPNQVLTRAQAVTIMIRSLGLEHLAPNPPYHTGFGDDMDIPTWSKDAVYVARGIGLAHGDMAGYFRPHDPMTNGEAAAFLSRFLTYLQVDLKKDFRERIISNK
jgi:hypothetical protein